MHTIRHEQMAAFLEHAAAATVAIAVRHARCYHGEVVGSDDEAALALRMRIVLDIARGHGFVTVPQALKFVNLMLELGDDFHRRAPYAAVLGATHLAPPEKILHVRRLMAQAAAGLQP